MLSNSTKYIYGQDDQLTHTFMLTYIDMKLFFCFLKSKYSCVERKSGGERYSKDFWPRDSVITTTDLSLLHICIVDTQHIITLGQWPVAPHTLKHVWSQSKLTETGLEVFVVLLSLNSADFPSSESLFPTDETGIPLSLVSNWELSLWKRPRPVTNNNNENKESGVCC